MNVAITPVIEKIPVLRKIASSGMFENHDSVGLQYILPEYQIRYIIDIRHIVRWIGKNNIIPRLANGDEMESVVADNADLA